MLKAIVIGDKMQLPMFELLANVPAGADAVNAIEKYSPDVVLVSPDVAKKLNRLIKKRTAVTSSTHQGMQVVSSDKIYFFEAEHKYVVAHHIDGQLLISDSLNTLEQDFNGDFIRIHRNTLVAIKFIESLNKGSDGKCTLKLKGIKKKFSVSRRQLSKVRQAITNL